MNRESDSGRRPVRASISALIKAISPVGIASAIYFGFVIAPCIIVLGFMAAHDYFHGSPAVIRELPSVQRNSVYSLQRQGMEIYGTRDKSVTSLVIYGHKAGNEEAYVEFANLPDVVSISMSDVPDAGKWLGSIKTDWLRVCSLNLERTGTTNGDLDSLRRFPNLSSLVLDGTQVDAQGMANLRHVPKLETLSLSKCSVSGGLMPLAELTQLKSLYLDDTGVTDGDLLPLYRLPLDRLSVKGTHVTVAALPPLATSLKLSDLNLPRLRPLPTTEQLSKFKNSQGKTTHVVVWEEGNGLVIQSGGMQ